MSATCAWCTEPATAVVEVLEYGRPTRLGLCARHEQQVQDAIDGARRRAAAQAVLFTTMGSRSSEQRARLRRRAIARARRRRQEGLT